MVSLGKKANKKDTSIASASFRCSSTMAKHAIDVPMKLKKTEPKPSHPRRNSTGNSISIQIIEPTPPIANHLRASIGSCHDFCKYGIKHDFQPKSRPPLSPKQDNKPNLVVDKSSDKNPRVKKVLASPKSVAVSSRQRLNDQSKPKPFTFGKNAFSHIQTAVQKQPKRTFLKGSSDIRKYRNDSSKDIIRTSKTGGGTKSNSLPLASSSSVKVTSPKSRTRKSFHKKNSQLEIKNNCDEKKTEKTSDGNIPEKIIHVIEPKDEKRNEDECNKSTALSPDSNQNLEMYSEAEKRIRATITTRGGRVIQEEKVTSPKKMKSRRGKVVEIQNGNDVCMEKSLRALISDKKFIHRKNGSVRGVFLRRQTVEQRNGNTGLMNAVIEETASKLVKMRKSKVKALVGAFESVISIQDYESPRTSTIF